jgi:hypothetical protein
MIRLNCPNCAKKLGVQEAMAGRMAICPQCKGKFRVPEEEIIITEAAVEEAVTAAPKPPPPLPKPRPPARDRDDEDDEEPVRRKRRRYEDDNDLDDEDEPRPRKKKKKRKKKAAAAFGGLNPIVVALIVMGVALLACVVLLVVSPTLAKPVWQVGQIVAGVGAIWCLVIAFQDSAAAGLMCLFIPFYNLYYLIAHFEECQRPLFLYLLGLGMVIAAFMFGGVAVMGLTTMPVR